MPQSISCISLFLALNTANIRLIFIIGTNSGILLHGQKPCTTYKEGSETDNKSGNRDDLEKDIPRERVAKLRVSYKIGFAFVRQMGGFDLHQSDFGIDEPTFL